MEHPGPTSKSSDSVGLQWAQVSVHECPLQVMVVKSSY